jgi:hypothetical protein
MDKKSTYESREQNRLGLFDPSDSSDYYCNSASHPSIALSALNQQYAGRVRVIIFAGVDSSGFYAATVDTRK